MGRAPLARESGSLDWVRRAMAGGGALRVRGCASCGRPGVGKEDSVLTGEGWPSSGEKLMVENCGRKGGSRGLREGRGWEGGMMRGRVLASCCY